MLKPILIVKHQQEPLAAAFYKAVFGAETVTVHKLPDGTPFSYELQIADAAFCVSGADPKRDDEAILAGPKSPGFLGASTCMMTLGVPDLYATVERAETAGAAINVRPSIASNGKLGASITDPFGHHWMVFALDIAQIRAAA